MAAGLTRTGAAVALVAIAVWPATAQKLRGGAGTSPCVLDKCLNAGAGDTPAPGGLETPPPAAPSAQMSAGPMAAPRRAPIGPGDFDFYVLALSWSPGFCDAGGARRSPAQCAPGRRLGFVVHGLWPQNQRGYPTNCDNGARFPSRAALDGVRDLYPDQGLARHEWRTHGTCSGLSPTDYFAAVRQASDGITVPPAFTDVAASLTATPRDVTRAFMASNAGLRADTMAVTCRGGALAEVRLCLAKDLRSYAACPEVTRDSCRTRVITVPPSR